MKACTLFYRNISEDSYNYITDKRDGIMEKYEKNGDEDPANPINGQISGLSFRASTDEIHERFTSLSMLDANIVGILPNKILNERTNLYFASFHDDKVCVHLVLSENHTKADTTCLKFLHKLDKYKNPFLHISKADPQTVNVTTGVDIQVFYTQDVNLRAIGSYDNGTLRYQSVQ